MFYRKGFFGIILFILIVLFASSILMYIFIKGSYYDVKIVNISPTVSPTPISPVSVNNTINNSIINTDYSFIIANWNLQIFGQSKANNPLVMSFYDGKISQYDIMFVQEIRDISGTAFPKLCALFEGYKCNVSMRDGRTDSKEQIGIIYRDNYQLISLIDLSDPNDVWERSPIKAVFNVSGFVFTAYNAHLKPEDVVNELNALYDVVENNGNVVVLGDFNAACSYYDTVDSAFDDWTWLVTDDADTTVAKTGCAYDRIMVNNNMMEHITTSGVDNSGINITFSDHYIVYTEVLI